MIKTIIFDYAGVITPTRDKYVFATQNHKRFDKTPHELMDILYKNWHDATVNKISDKEYWKQLSQDLDIPEEEIKHEIIEAFPIEQRVVELLTQLKGKYTLVMMSNQIEDWLESEIDKNNLRDKFELFINSYQVRMKKPDKEIFLHALETINNHPSEILFIDDSEKNILVAKELGFQTIQFDTYEQFIREFQEIIQNELL